MRKRLLSFGFKRLFFKNALLVISKSFNSFLDDSFHKRVIEKFPTLDEVVVLFTGALPEDTKDED